MVFSGEVSLSLALNGLQTLALADVKGLARASPSLASGLEKAIAVWPAHYSGRLPDHKPTPAQCVCTNQCGVHAAYP